jgi:hypothetical protein
MIALADDRAMGDGRFGPCPFNHPNTAFLGHRVSRWKCIAAQFMPPGYGTPAEDHQGQNLLHLPGWMS